MGVWKREGKRKDYHSGRKLKNWKTFHTIAYIVFNAVVL